MAELMTQARHATLLDLLDRLLGKGVVAYGDVILSIADLDLVYLNLRAVLSAIGTLENSVTHITPRCHSERSQPEAGEVKNLVFRDSSVASLSQNDGLHKVRSVIQNSSCVDLPQAATRLESLVDEIGKEKAPLTGGRRLELDPQKVEQGLAKLVLTLINLLRKLMERQAIRRMEQGTLTEAQMERSGQAFKRLDQKMEELKKQFGLADEDLNLDLGPLGELV